MLVFLLLFQRSAGFVWRRRTVDKWTIRERLARLARLGLSLRDSGVAAMSACTPARLRDPPRRLMHLRVFLVKIPVRMRSRGGLGRARGLPSFCWRRRTGGSTDTAPMRQTRCDPPGSLRLQVQRPHGEPAPSPKVAWSVLP